MCFQWHVGRNTTWTKKKTIDYCCPCYIAPTTNPTKCTSIHIIFFLFVTAKQMNEWCICIWWHNFRKILHSTSLSNRFLLKDRQNQIKWKRNWRNVTIVHFNNQLDIDHCILWRRSNRRYLFVRRWTLWEKITGMLGKNYCWHPDVQWW